MELRGKAVSAGYAAGRALCYERFEAEVPELLLEEAEIAGALEQLTRGRERAVAELEALCARSGEGTPAGAIFRAHLDILRDRVVEKEIRARIEKDRKCLPWAVAAVYDKYRELMRKAKNPMFQERAADFEDVKGRVLRCCAGVGETDLSHLDEPVILVCHDLPPSDTANLDREKVLAIVTEVGGETSHSAILARNLSIPAVLGVSDLLTNVGQGDMLAVDAVSGAVWTEPDGEKISAVLASRAAWLEEQRETAQWRGRPCLTADGQRIGVFLNMGADDALDDDALEGLDGVGLLRTEFLYMNSKHMPTEEEQFASYRRILEGAGGRPVVLRTLDIGGDKTLDYFPLPKESNPFLGERAIRLCLSHPDLFRTQLRAALRASVYGTLWIMFPMIASLEDIRAAKAQLEQARQSLTAEGVPFDPEVKVGVMIEIPSIALMADQVAAEVDFASIGSNDLVQYLEAADRMNPAVAAYYDSFHPAAFRLIGYTAREFQKAGKPLSVCGEMAGKPRQAMILAGLGLRKLSMSPAMTAQVKKTLAGYTQAQLEDLARAVCAAGSAEQVRGLLPNE